MSVPSPSPSRNSNQLTVERGKRGSVVELGPERVVLGRELAQDVEPELAGPPVAAPGSAAGRVADLRALPKRLGEGVEGRLARSHGQQASLVGGPRRIRTPLGRGLRQEPGGQRVIQNRAHHWNCRVDDQG